MNRCPFIPESEWWPPGASPRALLCSSHRDPGQGCVDEEDSCPGAYARTGVAIEAWRARAWWEKGQLALLFGEDVPPLVIAAVDVADQTRREVEDEGVYQRQPKEGGSK